MTTEPWWGDPVIAGSFLVIGGALTFLYSYLMDRRKHARDDVLEWNKELHGLYVKTVQSVTYVSGRKVKHFKNSDLADTKRSVSDGLVGLEEVHAELALMGADDVKREIGRLESTALKIQYAVNGDTPVDIELIRDLLKREEIVLTVFKGALRPH